MTHEEETDNFVGQHDEYDDDYEGDGCYNCGGSGWIITCIDDMCHGAGECMHGDGEDPCPVCNKDMHKDPV
jgi:hypothetical protein